MNNCNINKHYIPSKLIVTYNNKYELNYINSKNEVDTISIPLQELQNDTIISSIDILSKSNISDLESLINLFSNLKQFNLKFVFEWVIIFTEYDFISVDGAIYIVKKGNDTSLITNNLLNNSYGKRKDSDTIRFEKYLNNSTLSNNINNNLNNKHVINFSQILNSIIKKKNIPGVIDLFNYMPEHNEDVKKSYGYFTYYTSDVRSLILVLVHKLRQVNECTDITGKLDSLMINQNHSIATNYGSVFNNNLINNNNIAFCNKEINDLINNINSNFNSKNKNSIQKKIHLLVDFLAISLFTFNKYSIDQLCKTLLNFNETSQELKTLCVILPNINKYANIEDNPFLDLIKITVDNISNKVKKDNYFKYKKNSKLDLSSLNVECPNTNKDNLESKFINKNSNITSTSNNNYYDNHNYNNINNNSYYQNNILLKFMFKFLLSDNMKYSDLLDFLYCPDIHLTIKLTYLVNKCPIDIITKAITDIENFSKNSGKVKGLILSGTSLQASKIISAYLDRTDNILISYVLCNFFCSREDRFYYKVKLEFNDMLNKLEMFNTRIKVNSLLENISKLSMFNNDVTFELSQNNSEIKDKSSNINYKEKENKLNTSYLNTNESTEYNLTCCYCFSKVQNIDLSKNQNYSLNNNVMFRKDAKEKINYCNNPKCTKPLPVCCICLQSIEIENNYIFNKANNKFTLNTTNKSTAKLDNNNNKRKNELKLNNNNNIQDSISIIWCLKCRHGGHLEHIKEWFTDLTICPDPNCDCICLENSLMLL